jgi:hypothetical protein
VNKLLLTFACANLTDTTSKSAVPICLSLFTCKKYFKHNVQVLYDLSPYQSARV